MQLQRNIGCAEPSVAFATLQAALDSLAETIIPPDKTVTIHIYVGTFVPSAVPAELFSRHAAQINVIGEPRVDRTITAIDIALDAQARHRRMCDRPLGWAQAVYIANSVAGWAGGLLHYGHIGVPYYGLDLEATRGPITTADHLTGRCASALSDHSLNDVGNPEQSLLAQWNRQHREFDRSRAERIFGGRSGNVFVTNIAGL